MNYIESIKNTSLSINNRLGQLGRKLWIILLLKLFIIFFVLKIFFFPNFMKTKFNNDADRANHVIESLTNQTKK